jgi:hypothetical protein
LFYTQNPHNSVFRGARHLENNIFQEVCLSLDSEPMEIRLDFKIGDEESGLTADDIE